MAWFRIDDQFLEHEKHQAYEDDPLRYCRNITVWLAIGLYCSRNATDGRFSIARVSRLCPTGIDVEAAVADLRDAGLVDAEQCVLHDFLDYNPSKADMEDVKRRRREKQKRYRDRLRVDRNVDGLPTGNVDRNVTVSRARDPDPTRPDPSRRDGEGRVSKIRDNSQNLRKNHGWVREGRFAQVLQRLYDLVVAESHRWWNAAELHSVVERRLQHDGWQVEREVTVPNRGDGYRGRLDLVARRDGCTVAIELDNQSPRTKSLAKLAGADVDLRVVVLRGSVCQGPMPDSLDALIGLRPMAAEWDLDISPEEWARRVRAERLRLGKTQRDVASVRSPSCQDREISRWERGKEVPDAASARWYLELLAKWRSPTPEAEDLARAAIALVNREASARYQVTDQRLAQAADWLARGWETSECLAAVKRRIEAQRAVDARLPHANPDTLFRDLRKWVEDVRARPTLPAGRSNRRKTVAEVVAEVTERSEAMARAAERRRNES